MTKVFHSVLFALMFGFVCFSQSNVPPSIQAVGDQFYCPLSQINVVTNFDIVDPDDTEVEAFHIQISTGYVSGEDLLTLTGTHPNIVATWIQSEGKLTLKGVANVPITYVDIIAAVNDVVFQSSSINVSGEKDFSFTLGDANYLPSTGHFYEYVQNLGITWSNARTLAETYTYYGLQGYLATITSNDEAQLSGEQAAGAGWIGGSDEAVEGVWRWMTGPEAGTIFWNGGINGNTPNYANWNTNEPNNQGNEDYAHVTAPGIGVDGSWNDLPNAGDTDSASPYHPQGFIVEYGGTPGDPIVDISASTKITVNEIVSINEDFSCGPNTITLEAFPFTGTVIWFDSPTGGSQLGTGTTFTTPTINTTTTYYALPSVNGCLEGVRQPVVATINDIPTITSVTDDLICGQGTGTVSATSSSGTINWYATPTGGTSLATGNTYTTPSVSSTTTYYVDATANSCTTLTRTPVTVTVQITPPPTGNVLQTFCDLENATLSDLTITGTDILWYDAALGGNLLNDTDELTTTTYYASQTINNCVGGTFAIDVIVYETVETLQPSEIPVFEQCDSALDGDDANGLTNFDLTQYDSLLLNGSNASDFSINYFSDAGYSSQIANPTGYSNTIQDVQTIYVRINNNLDNSCFSDTSFTIQVNELPVVQPAISFKNCDEDGVPDGFTDFNLTEVDDLITIGNASGLNITYHLVPDASDVALVPFPFNNMIANTVYGRVENANGCYKISTINLEVSTTSFVSGFMQELDTCDDDAASDGLHVFDLSQASQLFIDEFPTGQNLSVHYYRNLADAQLEQNEIVPQTNYINEDSFSQLIYVRVESADNGDCFGIGPHLTLTVHPRPEFEIDDASIYCLDGNPIILETFNPNGNYSYQWTDEFGTVVSAAPFASVNSGGMYTVVATSSFGCESFPETFNVVESAIADIGLEDVTVTDFSNNNTITINNTNNNLGIGDYEFALGNINGPYQDEPFFNNVAAGTHYLFARDKNGCGVSTALEVFVLGFPKYFTPNGDMYNNTWNLKGWNNAYSQQSRIYIYDRYGKLIKQLSPSSNGWDGTFNGQELRNTDFWFVAELIEHDGTTRTLKGHFSLVR